MNCPRFTNMAGERGLQPGQEFVISHLAVM
jgi:hypothetical protein